MKSKIKATIIADSMSPVGHSLRMTTFLLTYPRIIHHEVMAFKGLSKVSAETRTIPFKTMLSMAIEDPFVPIAWQKDHDGIQGYDYIINDKKGKEVLLCNNHWMAGRSAAITEAERLSNIRGVTKQICNRMLEPYTWQTTLITGTDFNEIFALMKKKDAEIHMQVLATEMFQAYQDTPKTLKMHSWHIPFGDKIPTGELLELHYNRNKIARSVSIQYSSIPDRVAIATATIARIADMTFDEVDYEKDLELHNKLLEKRCLSAFEHCGRAMEYIEYNCSYVSQYVNDYLLPHTDGCNSGLRGFIPYRFFIENKLKWK